MRCLAEVLQEAGAIRNKREYTEFTTQKAGTYFTTTKLKNFSERYFDLNEQYEKRQKSLEKEIIGIAGESPGEGFV